MKFARAVRFTPLAAQDVEDAIDWYHEQRQGLGTEFETSVSNAMTSLLQTPALGPAVHRDMRRLLLRRFPYALYYRVVDDIIEVRGCFHQHRDPASWRGRV